MNYVARLLKTINALPPSKVIKIRNPEEIGSKALPRIASSIFRSELLVILAILTFYWLLVSFLIPTIPPFSFILHPNPIIAFYMTLLYLFGFLAFVLFSSFSRTFCKQEKTNRINRAILTFVKQPDYLCLREVMAVYPELHSARHRVGYGRIRHVEANYIRAYDQQRGNHLPSIKRARQERMAKIRLW